MTSEIILPKTELFESAIDGKAITLYILKNKNNIQAAISNYGARWVSMIVPDKAGIATDVIVGFNSINGYINSTEAYYGAVVGRYANRIAKGQFMLNEKKYFLAINNPPNHLHGGIKGFHAVVWDVIRSDENSILLKYISADGEEGYPGKLEVTVEYYLQDDNTMRITFSGTTDQPTVISLAHHAYFNLNGQGSGTILDHSLMINADTFTSIDATSIPFGILEEVQGTPFDFRKAHRIGERINDECIQLKNGNGYDHNFVLNQNQPAASVTGNLSGICMDVITSEPGIQLYTGNFMNKENVLKGGYRDGKREAFCLETQHFPDSPNHKNFPSVVLNPGEIYKSTTSFIFK